MPYEKTTWQKDDIITSAKLNKAEEQIAANAEAAETAAAQATQAATDAQAAVAQAQTNAQAIASQADVDVQHSASIQANADAIAAQDAVDTQHTAAIAANLEKINTLIADLAANGASDATVKGIAEANQAAIATLQGDYVSKTVTKNGFNAQSQYNLTTYKYTDANGNSSMLHNEASGGGIFVTDKGANVKAFIGCNIAGAKGGIYAQFYAKDATTNSGTRMNFTDNGIFYTVGKTSGAFVATDEVATKGNVQEAIAGIAMPADQSAQIEALKAQIAVLTNVINSKKVGQIAEDVSAGGEFIDANSDVTITADSTITNNLTVSGKTVTIQDVATDGATTKITATGSVNINGFTGANVAKATSNATLSVNTSDTVYAANVDVNAVYNGIEIGLATNAAPSDIVIDGATLASGNNAILIFNTADNANITIKNCTVGQVSEFLRISNRDNVHVNVFLENVAIEALDANLASGWSNIVLCQDYTSATVEDVVAANRFSPDKVKIFLKNVTIGGEKVTEVKLGASSAETGSTTCIVYSDKGGTVAGTETARYPEITILD